MEIKQRGVDFYLFQPGEILHKLIGVHLKNDGILFLLGPFLHLLAGT